MSVYIGSLGRLVELPYVSSHSMEPNDRYTFSETLEGRVKAQAKAVGRRVWSLSGTRYLASTQGTLMAFINGEWGNGPWVWVSADAQVTNMLTPAVSSCGPSAVVSGASTLGGPLENADGTVAGRSLRNSNTASNMPFGKAITPVIPGVPVTGSAYVLGAGAKVGVAFYDSAGAWISAALSTGAGSAGVAVRLSATVLNPPSNAVSCSVYAVSATAGARPAITWTRELFDWADGQGCAKAVVHGASKELRAAHKDPNGFRAANMPFTITEVG